MTLIVVKNKTVLDLPSILRIALKTIYEPKNVTSLERDQMMSSIIDWKNHLDTRRGIGFNAVDEENQIALEYIGGVLKDDAQGNLDGRKETFLKHKIDYKKFYRLPGAVSLEDVARAKWHHSQLPKEEQ